MAKPLVIVESPAKAKTLGRFLGNKYRVEASYGHIRDLPESAAEVPKEIKEKDWGRLGVDVDQDFTPYYVVPGDKKKQVAHLKGAVKEASELLLATDPDREGESISWHLAQVLKPRIPVRRIVFHEITEEAVKEALANPGDVNENLVRAQESRRILDRLYGYTLSPVLWKKVQTGLSAGPRAERGGSADRRARGRASRVPHGGVLGPRGHAQGRRPRIHRHARQGRRPAHRQRQGLRSADRRAEERQRAAAGRTDDADARRCASRERAVDGDVRRAETRRRAAGAAVHDLHAHAGGKPQAGICHRADDADCAAAVSGRGFRGQPGRVDYRITAPTPRRCRTRRCRNQRASSAACSARSITTRRAATRRA